MLKEKDIGGNGAPIFDYVGRAWTGDMFKQ